MTTANKTTSDTNGTNEILIIGAGVAGLAAGCYLQMNGFQTRILERHTLPGGCCTAWTREGYVFDYCIEWLNGTDPNSSPYKVWHELGALNGKSIKTFEQFNRVIDADGQTVNFYTDPDRLEQHLLSISPEDERLIKNFCRYMRRFQKLDLCPPLAPIPLMGWKQKLSMAAEILPQLGLFWRTGGTQMDDFCDQLTHPLLKKTFPLILMQDHGNFSLIPYLYTMAAAGSGNAGFPEGGSLGLSQSIARRYLDLGGKIDYKIKVDRILLEKDGDEQRAVGVKLKNGREIPASKVISTIDGHTTLFHLLEGKYMTPTLDKLYHDILPQEGNTYPGLITVFVGCRKKVGEGEPHSTTYILNEQEAELLPECMQGSILLQHRSRMADGFTPQEGSVIRLAYFTYFDRWDRWRNEDKPHYRRRKEEIITFIRSFLEKHYPGINETIDVIEVATPVTMKRYTGNTGGAILGWKSEEADNLLDRLINKDKMQLPGLKNFYMAGHWVAGGSLIKAAVSGRYVAQFLCKNMNRPFDSGFSNYQGGWHPDEWGLHLERSVSTADQETSADALETITANT
ncbi:phytoene desaturase family protein [Gynuella sp.]|uniref:phytoene desaturase family protein n=1 Tax=Gynuella sp. TaxID=2969146 RepID=UPI003D0FFDB5